jgi:hypothetical protein
MRTLLIVFLWTSALVAQHPRDSWKLKPFDLEAHLTHPLADAPLTTGERDQIYRAIESSGADSADRDAIMDFRVGAISLAKNGSEQILVRGTKYFCGATGNCSMWIFARQAGKLRLVLGTEGQGLIVQATFRRGFRDIAIVLHESATSHLFTDYRWDGVAYKPVDCYETQYPIEGDGPKEPTIVGCQ